MSDDTREGPTQPRPPGEDAVLSPVWDSAPATFPTHLYGDRARAVYWNDATPACRASGPRNAECLLNPGHEGAHFGNGYDKWGPLGAQRWAQRKPQPPGRPDR